MKVKGNSKAYCPHCSRPKSAARWGQWVGSLLLLRCPCGYAWALKGQFS